MTELGFQTQVYNDLEEMPNRIKFPDKTNRGKLIAMLMMWKRVADLAQKKYETLLDQLVGEGMMTDPKSISIPGTYVIAESAKLAVEVSVSKFRKEFNLEWFANKLEKDYKVPFAITRSLMEQAKQEGTVQSRTIKVKEL